MIPPDRMAAVTRALRETFDVTDFEDIRRLTTGHSGALVFRMVVRGSPFLLRIIMRNPDQTLPQHFECMRTAAEAELAPRIRYTSIEDRLSITDFVQTVPLSAAEGLERIPAMLRALHALPPFPGRENHLNTTCMFLLHKGPALDGFLDRFRASGVMPKEETGDLLAWHGRLAAAYTLDEAEMVSCHNDLFKPDNILFDGRRLWLVDWEAAFRNDRYADLAAVSNLIVRNDQEEARFLEAYFGRPANSRERSRFFLMRQIVHVFYAMAFLWLGSGGKPVDLSEPAPDFDGLHRRMWAGELDLTDGRMKVALGRAHFEKLRQAGLKPSASLPSPH